MSEDRLIRRENLLKAMKAQGMGKSPSALGKALGKSRSQCAAWINGDKSMSDDTARMIEHRLGLLRYSLNEDHGDEPPPIAGPGVERVVEASPSATLVFKNETFPVTDRAEKIVEETTDTNKSPLSYMAARIAREFELIKDPDARTDTFAKCIAAITKAIEQQK